MRFQCLGVTWAIEFGNHEPDVAVGERFAATLQITLAHLALADPALLPTSVKVLVTAGTPGTDLAIEQVDSTPTETCFRCTLAATEHRSQLRNREAARERLDALLAGALAPDPAPRRPTRPTAGSRRRRLDAKTRRGAIKRLRGRPDE